MVAGLQGQQLEVTELSAQGQPRGLRHVPGARRPLLAAEESPPHRRPSAHGRARVVVRCLAGARAGFLGGEVLGRGGAGLRGARTRLFSVAASQVLSAWHSATQPACSILIRTYRVLTAGKPVCDSSVVCVVCSAKVCQPRSPGALITDSLASESPCQYCSVYAHSPQIGRYTWSPVGSRIPNAHS